MARFYGFDIAETAGPSNRDDILRLLEAMRPKPSPAALVRIGPNRDGAYLLPDDLEGIAACFSPGAANRKDFEDQLATQYGIASHMCDASSDLRRFRTPPVDGMQTFEKLWLDVTGAEDTISLDDWVARHRPDPDEDLILQMDIEGAEYRNLLQTSDKTLLRFRIIVVELHGLHRIENADALSHVFLPFFESLGRHFTCVHAHPNNYAPPEHTAEINVAGIAIPRLVELTFLRNDRFEGRSRHDVELPHPLDIAFNVSYKPPVFLDDFFRGRPPSEEEARRMEDDIADWHRCEKKRAICDRNRGSAKAAGVLRRRLRQENRRLRKDITRAAKATAKTIAAKDAEIAKLKKETRRLGERLRQLRASTSWRLTAPLRWIVSKIRT